ncbi:hypothetical protein CR513_40790, partial [Mucuna pruriens]
VKAEKREFLDSIKRETQSVNEKLNTLSRGKKENRQPSVQESEASYEEVGHVSESSKSHRSHRHGHNERLERHERHKKGRDEPRRDELESVKEKFVPTYYARDLYVKLQRLQQGSKGVYEYFKEMKIYKMRAQKVESQEETMAMFLHRLNREIQDIVARFLRTTPYACGSNST